MATNKERILKSGERVRELNKAVTLTVYTRCPEKYMLTDMETGEVYVGYPTEGSSSWRKISS